MTGIYIHIPFCVHKCVYCDFPSVGGAWDHFGATYIQALCREINAAPDGVSADTVYFGGGTPSLVPSDGIGEILNHVRRKFCLTDDAEITMEANPDSIDEAYARAVAACGVNRISLGIQSFRDGELRSLQRVHTAKEGLDAVYAIRSGGIFNISIDLMYGLPGQHPCDVAYDLRILETLPVTHASIYSLIVEDGTALKAALERGEITLPADDETEAMANLVHREMAHLGFTHYEISSYAREGYQSRHNRKYWCYEPYYGFGIAAHSFDGTRRWENIRNIPVYIQKAGRDPVVEDMVQIEEDRAVEDYCFLALRMREGIDYDAFRRRFGRDIHDEFGREIVFLAGQGLLEETEKGCALTKKGLAYGNYVFAHFVRA